MGNVNAEKLATLFTSMNTLRTNIKLSAWTVPTISANNLIKASDFTTLYDMIKDAEANDPFPPTTEHGGQGVAPTLSFDSGEVASGSPVKETTRLKINASANGWLKYSRSVNETEKSNEFSQGCSQQSHTNNGVTNSRSAYGWTYGESYSKGKNSVGDSIGNSQTQHGHTYTQTDSQTYNGHTCTKQQDSQGDSAYAAIVTYGQTNTRTALQNSYADKNYQTDDCDGYNKSCALGTKYQAVCSVTSRNSASNSKSTKSNGYSQTTHGNNYTQTDSNTYNGFDNSKSCSQTPNSEGDKNSCSYSYFGYNYSQSNTAGPDSNGFSQGDSKTPKSNGFTQNNSVSVHSKSTCTEL